MSLIQELKRRNVFRVGLAYVVGAWLMLQLTDVLTELLDLPGEIGRTVVMVLAIGFVPVLLLAWAFELTPEGIKREKEVDRSQSITPRTGRVLDRTIIVLLALVIVGFGINEFVIEPRQAQEVVTELAVEEPAAEPLPPSVAVLPFDNMSNDPDNEYFSDGLTETLLHMLAQLPDLRVAARTSSFAFKNKEVGIAEIARTLNVAHVLEGSVQKSGDRVRVTAQLIRADDGFHVWSQNYTRPLEDIFAIQDEIARDVVGALDESLLGNISAMHGVETRNMSAYETYLKALEQQALFSYASLPAAENLFKEALAIDPDFTDAKLGLVRNQFLMMRTGLLNQEQAWAQSEPLIQQILNEDPGNLTAEALALSYRIWFTSDIGPAELALQVERLRQILPGIPTESVLLGVAASITYFRLNDPDSALTMLDAGLLLDPLDPGLLDTRGRILGEIGRFAEAERYLMSALEQQPGDANILADISDLKAKMGDAVGGLSWMRRASEADPRDHELAADVAEQLYALGLVEEGDTWARRVLSQAPQSAMGRKIALLQAVYRDERARALELAEAMMRDGISVRRGALGAAVFTYTRLMAIEGRAAEALALIEELRPEAVVYDGQELDLEAAIYLMASSRLMPLLQSPDEVATNWAIAMTTLDKILPRRVDQPNSRFWDAVLLGDHDGALRLAREEVFTQPIPVAISLPMMFENPALQPLADEPEIQAELAQLDRRIAQARAEVEDMLLQPEWSE